MHGAWWFQLFLVQLGKNSWFQLFFVKLGETSWFQLFVVRALFLKGGSA
jgi:hypothetical protein